MNDNYSESVLTRIASILGLEIDQVGLDISLEELPGWDSMAAIQLTLLLEDDFGIRFSDAEARNGWVNVRAIIDSIKRLAN